ncbi:MAG: CdaR family protein [Chloroflexota bacterium]
MGLPRIDGGRALLALALAFAVWIVVQNEQNPDRTDVPAFSVPIEVVNLPPGLVVVSENPLTQVRVRLPSEAWPGLSPASFRATADASNATAGVNELNTSVESLSQQVRMVEPIPPRVNVALEEVTDRVTTVKLNIVGNVPFGYAYSAPRVSPENVTISGASSAVGRVDAVLVDLRLDAVTVSLNGTYAPRAVDARGELVRSVRVAPSTVNVDVPVAQQVAYKEVGVRPVTRGRLAPGYALQPVEVEPSTATVVGSPTTLRAVEYVETEPIDVGGLSSIAVRRVQVTPPQGLSLLQSQPVTVTLRVAPVVVSQTLRLIPTASGLPPGLSLASEIPPVDVTISGPAPTLQTLSSRDFRVFVDLAGVRAGRNDLAPRVSLPAPFTLDKIEPPSVTVILREAPTPVASPSTGATGELILPQATPTER